MFIVRYVKNKKNALQISTCIENHSSGSGFLCALERSRLHWFELKKAGMDHVWAYNHVWAYYHVWHTTMFGHTLMFGHTVMFGIQPCLGIQSCVGLHSSLGIQSCFYYTVMLCKLLKPVYFVYFQDSLCGYKCESCNRYQTGLYFRMYSNYGG